jgi:hypothetical protein
VVINTLAKIATLSLDRIKLDDRFRLGSFRLEFPLLDTELLSSPRVSHPGPNRPLEESSLARDQIV